MFGDEVDHVVQRREHAEAEQIEFDEPDGGAVVLVPLQDGATGHACPFDGDDIGDGTVADHHPARVDSEVSRKTLDLGCEPEHGSGISVVAAVSDSEFTPPQRLTCLLHASCCPCA